MIECSPVNKQSQKLQPQPNVRWSPSNGITSVLGLRIPAYNMFAMRSTPPVRAEKYAPYVTTVCSKMMLRIHRGRASLQTGQVKGHSQETIDTCRLLVDGSVFPHSKLELITQFPASIDKKHICIYGEIYVFKILFSDQLSIYHRKN